MRLGQIELETVPMGEAVPKRGPCLIAMTGPGTGFENCPDRIVPSKARFQAHSRGGRGLIPACAGAECGDF